MKKTFFLFAAGFIIICLAFNQPVSDYRDSYVGNYFCNSSCQGLNSDHSALRTINDTLTITVAKDPLDSILQITIHRNTFQVKLKNNFLYPYPPEKHWSGRFFASDSIGFASSVTLGPTGCSYSGKKR